MFHKTLIRIPYRSTKSYFKFHCDSGSRREEFSSMEVFKEWLVGYEFDFGALEVGDFDGGRFFLFFS